MELGVIVQESACHGKGRGCCYWRDGLRRRQRPTVLLCSYGAVFYYVCWQCLCRAQMDFRLQHYHLPPRNTAVVQAYYFQPVTSIELAEMTSVSGGVHQLKIFKVNFVSWPTHKIKHLAVVRLVNMFCWCLYHLHSSKYVYIFYKDILYCWSIKLD